jgi:hypothetical protein
MKKLILLFIVLTVILLTSCELPKLIKVEESRYVIIHVDPPKRVHIDLKRVSDGKVFKGIYLKKRMSTWRNIVVGDTIVVKRYTYLYNSSQYTEFNSSEILQKLSLKYKL